MSLVKKYFRAAKRLREAIYGPTTRMLDDAAIADYMELLWEQMSDEEHKEIINARKSAHHISKTKSPGTN